MDNNAKARRILRIRRGTRLAPMPSSTPTAAGRPIFRAMRQVPPPAVVNTHETLTIHILTIHI